MYWLLFAERLCKGWHSPVYSFFKPEVKVGYDGKHKYHFFPCAARRCKGLKGILGVCCYQDSKDHAATSNLKNHTIKCFGQDVVDAAFSGKHPKAQDSSIFAAFAQQGQQPVKISHRAHTKAELWWVSTSFYSCPSDFSAAFILPDGVLKTTAPSALSKTGTSKFL